MITTNLPITERRLIFCISSGRAGSEYLAMLLGTAEGVKSIHEAEPKMIGPVTEWINTQPYAATFAQRRIKADTIAMTLQKMAPVEIYAETNHMFVKTFYDVVLERFPNVDVIILRRPLAHVLKSFIEMAYFRLDDPNPNAPLWMSRPDAVTAAMPLLAPFDEMDQYDRCIAYLLDIEARAQRFLRDYPNVRVHEVRLEKLLAAEDVGLFFERLRLLPTKQTWTVAGKRVNDRSQRKQRFNNPTTVEKCQARLDNYLARARVASIAIPATLALDFDEPGPRRISA